MKRPATTTSFIVSVSHINLPPDPLLRYNFDVSRPVDVDVAVSRRQKANAYQQQALDDLKPGVFRSGTDFISLVTLFLLLGATVIVGPRVFMRTRSSEQRADVMASFLLEIWLHQSMRAYLRNNPSNFVPIRRSGTRSLRFFDKKAELSQRRPRDAPNIWVPWKISKVLTSKRLLFPKFVMGFCSDRY